MAGNLFDLSLTPGGAETPPLIFHVVASIRRAYLPVVVK
jgi:hypothetical protein